MATECTNLNPHSINNEVAEETEAAVDEFVQPFACGYGIFTWDKNVHVAQKKPLDWAKKSPSPTAFIANQPITLRTTPSIHSNRIPGQAGSCLPGIVDRQSR